MVININDSTRFDQNCNVLSFQVLYYRGWCEAIETAISGLNASLLVLSSSDTIPYIVNIDPQIVELIQEAKYLQKMNLELDQTVIVLLSSEGRIRRIKEE